MELIDADGSLKPVLKILTDYPRDDLAHDEVHQSLVTACVKRGVWPANIDVGAIPGMDTIVAGFKTAQLVFNSALGYGHIFHTNCAPRKNIVTMQSKGEKIVLGVSRTGVVALIVNAGYTLAPFRAAAEAGDITFYQTSVPDSGSQFRSRDFFPDAMADLTLHLSQRLKFLGKDKVKGLLAERAFPQILDGLSYLGAPLGLSSFPLLPEGAVYYVDSFGNIKLNYLHQRLLGLHAPGTPLVIALGNTVCDAIVGDAGFSMGEGVIAITSGSSGWSIGGAPKAMFSEIFLRGGRAEAHFPGFKPGDPVLAMKRADLQRVIDMLRGAGRDVTDRLDLYNTSEPRIMHALARARLIRDGFDTTELQKSLEQNDLLKRLVA
jgi:hypothetical protein